MVVLGGHLFLFSNYPIITLDAGSISLETARVVVYSGQFCCGVPLCTCVGSEVFVDVDFLFEIPQGVSKLKQIALASRIVMPFQSCSSS